MNIMKKLFLLFLILVASQYSLNAANFVDDKTLAAIKKKYGPKALKRVKIWDKVVTKTKPKKILRKLKNVNDFFNKIPYKTDIKHWGKKDYWATPFEFMGTGAGDCEDYSIAKYYTLKKLGVKEDKLRIMYVKLQRKRTKYEESHMVLTYYDKPTSTPIVLDNVNKKLQLASKRKDLKPIYSFNAGGLWKAQNKGKSSKKVGKNNLKSWNDLMNRI